MSNWFYYDGDGQKRGPHNGGQLKWLAKQGTITPDTIVETEDGKTAPARRVKGLTFIETTELETVSPAKRESYGVTSPPPSAAPNPSVANVLQRHQETQQADQKDRVEHWHYFDENGKKIRVTFVQLTGLAKGFITSKTIVEYPDGHTGLAKDVEGLMFAAETNSEMNPPTGNNNAQQVGISQTNDTKSGSPSRGKRKRYSKTQQTHDTQTAVYTFKLWWQDCLNEMCVAMVIMIAGILIAGVPWLNAINALNAHYLSEAKKGGIVHGGPIVVYEASQTVKPAIRWGILTTIAGFILSVRMDRYNRRCPSCLHGGAMSWGERKSLLGYQFEHQTQAMIQCKCKHCGYEWIYVFG